MAAFFIATTKIKDAEKFQEYAGQAGQTISAHGGKMIARGKVAAALAGECTHQGTGIVRFPDMDTLSGWYNSAEYQALIPLRNEAVEMSLVAYQEPD